MKWGRAAAQWVAEPSRPWLACVAMSPGSAESIEKDVPDLGPAPQRLAVEVETVRSPRGRPVPSSGRTCPSGPSVHTRVGQRHLPPRRRHARAASQRQRSTSWRSRRSIAGSPELAKHLPVPIPAPLARGLPGARVSRSGWSVYGWLPGEPAAPCALTRPDGARRGPHRPPGGVAARRRGRRSAARHSQLVPRRHLAHLRRRRLAAPSRTSTTTSTSPWPALPGTTH